MRPALGSAMLALVVARTPSLGLASSSPLPAESPLRGPFWSLVVPVLLFVVTLASTYLLVRRFAGDRNRGRK